MLFFHFAIGESYMNMECLKENKSKPRKKQGNFPFISHWDVH